MKQWRFWLGITISLVCLILVLWNIDFWEVLTALKGANYAWLLPASLPYAGTLISKVLRWQLLFPGEHKRIRREKLFSALMISYALNTILPARLGELARAYVIGETEGLSKSLALSTIVVEKVLDILTLLLFLVLLLPFVTLPSWVQRPALIMGPLFLCLFAIILALTYQRQGTLSLASFFLKRIPRLSGERILNSLDSALSGFDVLRSVRRNISLWGWSLAVWITGALFILFVMFAFHIDAPPSAAVLLLCVTSLGMTVPSSPGYIGVYHWLVVSTLLIFNVDRELALSYAFALHAVTFLPLTLLGIFYMMRENYSLQKIERETLEGLQAEEQ
jgi:uncharacterized protein (TIRG00374 family)